MFDEQTLEKVTMEMLEKLELLADFYEFTMSNRILRKK